MLTLTQMINLAKLGFEIILVYIRTSTRPRTQVMGAHQTVYRNLIDMWVWLGHWDFQKKDSRESSYSVSICLLAHFNLCVHNGWDSLVSSCPLVERDHMIIYITPNYATKTEKGYSRYNSLFKIKASLSTDLLKGIVKWHICLEIRVTHSCCFIHGNCLSTHNLISVTKNILTAILFTLSWIQLWDYSS